jgi:uncharacterized membrane protein YsdA (DUF1294 family)
MKNQKIRNILILVIVAIAFGTIGYFIPHPIVHHKGHKEFIHHSRNITKNKVSSKVKHVTLTYIQGSISSVSTSTLIVNGTNIKVTKGTKIYSASNLENISSLSSGNIVSVVGVHTTSGIVARFIILM